MKNPLSLFKFLFINVLTLTSWSLTAQNCTWVTEVSDGFEYTSVCPDLIPGKTVHNVPQSFAVYTGNLSLYLNFVNCVGTTGACAGDKVYERKFYACPFQRYRFSAWLTTSFSGLQSNVHIKITDKLGNVLDDQLQIAAPYAPSWVQYQSAVVIPQSDTLIFTMYTNVGGGNGNDLSFDDFLFEKCLGPYTSATGEEFCSEDAPVNLFDSTPYAQSMVGTWSGPSSLSGGYLGVFNPQSNLPGTYLYTHYPFSNNCPVSYDTVIVSVAQNPQPYLGADTTLCTNQTILLNPGTGSGFSYLWNNGVTGPQVLAFAPGGNPTTSNYFVVVTDTASGCSASDSITVAFIICSGISETTSNTLQMYPNPANENTVLYIDAAGTEWYLEIYNAAGQLVQSDLVTSQKHTIVTNNFPNGIYRMVLLSSERKSLATTNLVVSGH